MLMLIRKTRESIFIDKGLIEIKVLSIGGGYALLGIQAPKDMDIDRKEIFLKNQTKSKSMEQDI